MPSHPVLTTESYRTGSDVPSPEALPNSPFLIEGCVLCSPLLCPSCLLTILGLHVVIRYLHLPISPSILSCLFTCSHPVLPSRSPCLPICPSFSCHLLSSPLPVHLFSPVFRDYGMLQIPGQNGEQNTSFVVVLTWQISGPRR